MERENSDLSGELVKREQEMEARAQEKEDLQSSLERTKEKLELELQGRGYSLEKHTCLIFIAKKKFLLSLERDAPSWQLGCALAALG